MTCCVNNRGLSPVFVMPISWKTKNRGKLNWEKTFLKVMTMWHNPVRPLNEQQRLLLHFIVLDTLLKPADRAC